LLPQDAAVLFSILYLILRGIGGDGTEPAVPSAAEAARRERTDPGHRNSG
jgi:hypothetical protein